MIHAEGWIEAYELLESGEELPPPLKEKVLQNRNSDGETMLHWYALEGEAHVLRKIIELGFDVNTQNEMGETPLYDAVRIDRWDNAQVLLQHGARTDLKDINGEDVWDYLEFRERPDKVNKLRGLIAASRDS